MSDDPATAIAQQLEELERRKRYERLTRQAYDPANRVPSPDPGDESPT